MRIWGKWEEDNLIMRESEKNVTSHLNLSIPPPTQIYQFLLPPKFINSSSSLFLLIPLPLPYFSQFLFLSKFIPHSPIPIDIVIRNETSFRNYYLLLVHDGWNDLDCVGNCILFVFGIIKEWRLFVILHFLSPFSISSLSSSNLLFIFFILRKKHSSHFYCDIFFTFPHY